MMNDLNWFVQRKYEDCTCCHCKTPIPVPKPFGDYVNYLGSDSDVNGYEWQSYCDKCTETLKMQSAEEVFNSHEAIY